jgi:putative DNA primase/helicase
VSFYHHASEHGLIVDHLIADGRWHRTKTVDKPRKRNGCYLFTGDSLVVRNWATMQNFSVFKDGRAKHISDFDFRVTQKKARERQESLWEDARTIAQDMLRRSAWQSHPYLVRKGFQNEPGWILDGELLIPMRDARSNALNSLQRITEDGAKLFLAGGKAKESVFKLGNERASERWLCEGYATGLSLREALRDLRRSYQVIVCFSAGNIPAVAKHIRKPAFVFADNDISKAGEEAANKTGLPWAMSPDVNADANDLHQTHGLRALVSVIRGLRAD